MKLFLQKLFIFSFPILGCFILMEIFYRITLNNYSFKNQKLHEKYNESEVVILGSSHTFYGVNPAFLDKPAFNLAQVSQTIYFDKLLLDTHMDKFKHLKYVILNIEYTSLSREDNTGEDVWRKYYYEQFMNLNVPIITNLDYQRYLLSSTKSFNFNVNLFWKYLKNNTLLTCDANGYGTDYSIKNKDNNYKKFIKEVIKSHEDGSSDFSINTNRLKDIIEKCNKSNIEVILLITPVTKQYTEGIKQEKWNKIVSVCERLDKKYSNTMFLNLFQDPRFTENDMFDSDHLNEEGAKKCSLILNSLLQ